MSAIYVIVIDTENYRNNKIDEKQQCFECTQYIYEVDMQLGYTFVYVIIYDCNKAGTYDDVKQIKYEITRIYDEIVKFARLAVRMEYDRIKYAACHCRQYHNKQNSTGQLVRMDLPALTDKQNQHHKAAEQIGCIYGS